VCKRRDGGTDNGVRTQSHATAKYGRPARPAERHTFRLFCLKRSRTRPWTISRRIVSGCVSAHYDTTAFHSIWYPCSCTERGGRCQSQDRTFRGVRLIGPRLPSDGLLISESTPSTNGEHVFGFDTRQSMHFCGYPHLDKDWFSIHPHRRHCARVAAKLSRHYLRHRKSDSCNAGNAGCFRAAQKAVKRLSLNSELSRCIQSGFQPAIICPQKSPRRRASMCNATSETVN